MLKIFSLVFSLVFNLAAFTQELNVMTFNIRFNNPGDSMNAWPYRKELVASQILFHEAHIVGVQEALYEQMTDLQKRLVKYKYKGVGRDDGQLKGEYSGIFYDTTRLEALQSKTFWLSETPDLAGSKSWDAAITRIVTWIKFRDKKTKKIFYGFNTHFDHIGKVARRESAKMLLQKIKEIAGASPAVVTGDFNATPDDEPVQLIVDRSDPLHLVDSKEISLKPHYGPTGTFNAFGQRERDDKPIDYIFLKGNWKVFNHATISQTWQGRFASDHFSVLARLQLN